MADQVNQRLPVVVLTGFLGSGKTTILQRLLATSELSNTAVLVNEFGEIGLDHHLLQADTTPTLLMENGCVCCAIRGDLQDALHDLFNRRERKQIPQFERVIVETSGLADPAPIAYTILTDPVLQHHFRLGNILTVVDAVNGLTQLSQFEESIKQVALADRIILTKTDLAGPEALAELRPRLQGLNGSAPVIETQEERADAQALVVEDFHEDASRSREVSRWLVSDENPGHHHEHTDDIQSISLAYEQPLDWIAFGIWMTMLLNRHGDRVLRIKAILNVQDVDTPVLINGVQHIVHQPLHLPEWPDDDRRSRLVMIVHAMDRFQIERSMRVFNQMAPRDASELTA